MVEERESSAAPSLKDAQGALGHAAVLTALVEEAFALPVTAGAFVAVWDGGNLLCQEHAQLQRISAWTALSTCQFIIRRGLRRIFVTQSGTRHVELAHLNTGNPTPQFAKELALLAFRRIQHPFAAVTFRDHSDRLRGVLLVTCTNDAEPTTADLDALDRMAARASRQIGLNGHMAVGGDNAIDTARSVPSDPELMRPVDSSLGAIGAWEMNDCCRKGEQFDETAFVPSEERRQRIRVPGRSHTDADNSVDEVREIIQETGKAPSLEARPTSFARQLHDTLDNIPDALCLLDQQWRFTFVNQRCERIIGHTRMDLLGQVIWEAFPQLGRSALVSAYEEAVSNEASRTVEVHLASIGADVEIRVHPGRHGIMLYFQDITERKRKEREVEHLAQHDSLTELPNRFALEQVLEQQCRQVVPRATGFYAVLFLDLDGFKDVNDTCGHVEADEVLVEVARRLQETVRNQDTVARYGGDEFVVVLCGLSNDASAAALETEQVARKLLDAIRTPFVVGGSPRRIDASIGAAISPIGEGETQCLLRQADAAMYRAKRGDAGRIGIFDGDKNESLLLEEEQDRQSVD